MLKHGIYLVKGSKYTINIWSLFETFTGRCLLELSWEICVTNLNEAFRENLETLMICVEISNLHLRHSAGHLAGAGPPNPTPTVSPPPLEKNESFSISCEAL